MDSSTTNQSPSWPEVDPVLYAWCVTPARSWTTLEPGHSYSSPTVTRRLGGHPVATWQIGKETKKVDGWCQYRIKKHLGCSFNIYFFPGGLRVPLSLLANMFQPKPIPPSSPEENVPPHAETWEHKPCRPPSTCEGPMWLLSRSEVWNGLAFALTASWMAPRPTSVEASWPKDAKRLSVTWVVALMFGMLSTSLNVPFLPDSDFHPCEIC